MRARSSTLLAMGVKSFSFIALIPAHAHALERLCEGRVRASTKGPVLFISRILALLQIRKKKKKKKKEDECPRTLAHHIKLPHSLLAFLSTALSCPPPPRRCASPWCARKIRRRWVVAEIGAARTGIRNEDGKCVVTPRAFSYILCARAAELITYTIEKSRHKGTQMTNSEKKKKKSDAAPLYSSKNVGRINVAIVHAHLARTTD